MGLSTEEEHTPMLGFKQMQVYTTVFGNTSDTCRR